MSGSGNSSRVLCVPRSAGRTFPGKGLTLGYEGSTKRHKRSGRAPVQPGCAFRPCREGKRQRGHGQADYRRGKKSECPDPAGPDLAALLGRLDINEAIPEELYAAVAEVFAMIYRLDQSLKNKDIK